MSENTGIHFGLRGSEFKNFITSILVSNKNHKLSPNDILLLTNSESMTKYRNAFTSKHVDVKNNYELYEHLGDVLYNYAIVTYKYKRFPQIKTTNRVSIAAVISNILKSKATLFKIASSLGFEKFITTTKNHLFGNQRTTVFEDVFEAFIGCTKDILDSVYDDNGAYSYYVIYDIIAYILDTQIKLTLSYEGLVDPISRLKETVDLINYENTRLYREKTKYTDMKCIRAYEIKNKKYIENGLYYCVKYLSVYQHLLADKEKAFKLNSSYERDLGHMLGFSYGETEKEAEEKASEEAITYLAEKGLRRPVPEEYENLDENETESKVDYTEEYLIQEYTGKEIQNGVIQKNKTEFDINGQYCTKFKFGIRTYTSTLLAMFCSNRNIEAAKLCLEMGADIYCLDSDGSSILDLLFIGSIDESLCKRFMRNILSKKNENKLKMQKCIYTIFYSKYQDPYFAKHLSDIEII